MYYASACAASICYTDSDFIKKSFTVCGIDKHSTDLSGEWLVPLNTLHSVLRCMIERNSQITNYVDTDFELEEAEHLMIESREDEDEIEDEPVELEYERMDLEQQE